MTFLKGTLGEKAVPLGMFLIVFFVSRGGCWGERCAKKSCIVFFSFSGVWLDFLGFVWFCSSLLSVFLMFVCLSGWFNQFAECV